MDLTPRQRQLVFAVIVIVLGGLGFFLLRSGTSGHHPAPPPSSPAAAASAPATTAPAPAQTGGSSTASSQVNIYQWLPFTEPQLARAASVVSEFARDYGTYSYTETSAEYVSRMRGLISGELSQVIASAYSTAGVTRTRSQQKQVSTGTAAIDSLRAFGATSLTFVVTVNQKITGTSPGRPSTQYAITVSDGGSGWQVTDIELASAGNQ